MKKRREAAEKAEKEAEEKKADSAKQSTSFNSPPIFGKVGGNTPWGASNNNSDSKPAEPTAAATASSSASNKDNDSDGGWDDDEPAPEPPKVDPAMAKKQKDLEDQVRCVCCTSLDTHPNKKKQREE
jgi:hypothetical protein